MKAMGRVGLERRIVNPPPRTKENLQVEDLVNGVPPNLRRVRPLKVASENAATTSTSVLRSLRGPARGELTAACMSSFL